MRWQFVFVCNLVFELVSCEEHHRSYEEKSRAGRLFTFNTVDDEIKLELQFTIPFITIPAKKAVDSVHGIWSGVPAININPATLAVGGAIVLGTTILLPFAIKSYIHSHSHHGYSRLLDSAQFSSDGFLDLAGKVLSDGEVIRGCSLRVACWTGKRNNMDHIRLLQEAMSNTLLSSVMNSTVIEDAIKSGRHGRDCSNYSPCPLREGQLPAIFNSLAAITNSIG